FQRRPLLGWRHHFIRIGGRDPRHQRAVGHIARFDWDGAVLPRLDGFLPAIETELAFAGGLILAVAAVTARGQDRLDLAPKSDFGRGGPDRCAARGGESHAATYQPTQDCSPRRFLSRLNGYHDRSNWTPRLRAWAQLLFARSRGACHVSRTRYFQGG